MAITNIPNEIIMLKFLQATWGINNIDNDRFKALEIMLSNENVEKFILSSNQHYMYLKQQYDTLKAEIENTHNSDIDKQIELDEKKYAMDGYNEWHNKFLKSREKFVELMNNISSEEIDEFNNDNIVQVKVNNTLYIAQKGSVVEINLGLGTAESKYIQTYHKPIFDKIFDNLENNNQKS